ncbi:MAG: caspase family protein [Thermoleophilia bacterium]
MKRTLINIGILAFASLILAGSVGTSEVPVPGKNLVFEPIPSQAQKDHDKHAVIVGIVYDNYEFGVVDYADRDAGVVYALLTEKLGYPEENVVLLQNHEATRENILGALKELADNPDIDGDSEVTVFYSGHGIRSAPDIGLNIASREPGYALVPYDFMSFDYRSGAGLIWDGELADVLGRLDPGKMWIMIDSCNAGGFTRPGITGPNRIVTMSSRAEEMSSEITDVQRGVFTHLFVELGLARGLSLEQAFNNAVQPAAAGYGQTPQIVDDYPGNLFLK